MEWIPRREDAHYLLKPVEVSERTLIQAARTAITFTDPKHIAQLFDKCHNILRTQKGLDAKERLFELSKLLVIKIYEEQRERQGERNRFTISFLDEAKSTMRMDETKIMNVIFDEVKSQMADGYYLFNAEDKIELPPHVIREIVELLEPYSFLETGEDVLGVAFETFLRESMTGKELGEFFTPREVVDFMVKLVDPKPGELILDPAVGTGGFLLYSFWHLRKKIEEQEDLSEEERQDLLNQIPDWLWGIDIYRFLVKMCRVNLKVHGCEPRHIYRANSLDLIDDNIPEREVEDRKVREIIKEVIEEKGGFDIILTNPPFGSGAKQRVRDPAILERYELVMRNRAGEPKPQIPQVLFLELCIRLLRPGGRMAIVLPDGILNNIKSPSPETRDFIRRECVIQAIIDLPP